MTVTGTTVAETKVTSFETIDRFGYLLFEQERNKLEGILSKCRR
jgi:hypothetical protein